MNNKIFVPNLSLVGKNKRRLTHHTHAGNQISVQIQAKLQNNYIFFFFMTFQILLNEMKGGLFSNVPSVWNFRYF